MVWNGVAPWFQHWSAATQRVVELAEPPSFRPRRGRGHAAAFASRQRGARLCRAPSDGAFTCSGSRDEGAGNGFRDSRETAFVMAAQQRLWTRIMGDGVDTEYVAWLVAGRQRQMLPQVFRPCFSEAPDTARAWHRCPMRRVTAPGLRPVQRSGSDLSLRPRLDPLVQTPVPGSATVALSLRNPSGQHSHRYGPLHPVFENCARTFASSTPQFSQ